jgi:hypothetical protein
MSYISISGLNIVLFLTLTLQLIHILFGPHPHTLLPSSTYSLALTHILFSHPSGSCITELEDRGKSVKRIGYDRNQNFRLDPEPEFPFL